MNGAPFGIGVSGVTTSLFAGHCVPSRASADCDPSSSGVQAGGSGLWSGPPTGLTWDASWASGLGSSGPFGSPGYAGWAKVNRAGLPFTVTARTVRSGPSLAFAEVRSKSRLKLVRHCVARSLSMTWLPGRNVFVPASYTMCTSVCTLTYPPLPVSGYTRAPAGDSVRAPGEHRPADAGAAAADAPPVMTEGLKFVAYECSLI